MIVCVDTNVFVQLFGRRSAGQPIALAVVEGRLNLAVSTPILLEYEEVARALYGASFWAEASTFLDLAALAGQVRQIVPQFQFRLITADPDDDAFADCAIAAGADFIITEDRHFDVLHRSGHRPRPIAPGEFIQRVLPTLGTV